MLCVPTPNPTLAVWGQGFESPQLQQCFRGCRRLALPVRRTRPNLGRKSSCGTSVESAQKTTKRSRGTIRKHRAGYQVRVSAGTDPVTGSGSGSGGTASTMKEAEKLRTKVLGEADTFRGVPSECSHGYMLDRWLPQHDIDENTRKSYESLIRIYLRPVLGDLPLTTLVRKAFPGCGTFGMSRYVRLQPNPEGAGDAHVDVLCL